LNVREAAAVAAWLESGKAAHVMRDHPHHAPWPMLGGMWGIRGGVVPDMANKIAAWGKWAAKVDDMYFLKAVIWPLIADDCVQHGYGGEPFPPHGPCDEFVGKTHGTFKRKGSIAAGKRTRPKWWQFRAKKFEKARAAANRALAANPNDLIAWRKLGDVLLGLKQYQKAVACYERVLAFEPDDRAIADKYAAATTLLKQKR
jgi:hypothetical protein